MKARHPAVTPPWSKRSDEIIEGPCVTPPTLLILSPERLVSFGGDADADADGSGCCRDADADADGCRLLDSVAELFSRVADADGLLLDSEAELIANVLT